MLMMEIYACITMHNIGDKDMGIDDTYMNDDDKDDKCRLIHQGKWFVYGVCICFIHFEYHSFR